MALTRRGFLGVVSAAMVGAVVYDTKTMLWVPQAVEAHGGVELPAAVVQADLTMTEIDRIVNHTGELNELALACAKRLGERLERHPGIALREVMYKHAGHVRVEEVGPRGGLDLNDRRNEQRLDQQHRIRMQYRDKWEINTDAPIVDGDVETDRPGYRTATGDFDFAAEQALQRHEDRQLWLEVEDEGRGRFEGTPARILEVKDTPSVDALTFDMAYRLGGYTMFAPLGVELRPGDAFDKDMLVGLGTDPVSGLSVRVLRFVHYGQQGQTTTKHALEVAGGWWKKKGHAAPDRYTPARKLSL